MLEISLSKIKKRTRINEFDSYLSSNSESFLRILILVKVREHEVFVLKRLLEFTEYVTSFKLHLTFILRFSNQNNDRNDRSGSGVKLSDVISKHLVLNEFSVWLE